MRVTRAVTPRNSLLLVYDPETGTIPQSMGGQLVASTPSCIAVGTLCAADGVTHITVTDQGAPLTQTGMQLVFKGLVETPRAEFSVCTVDCETIISTKVSGESTNLEVWANDAQEPDRICILVKMEGIT